ncbi:MAG: hypothetical protein K2K53_07075 [Oscillospiraceae bacterium]|nr:hypothetical protein [Oscillospiraceae bacterium]
MNKILDELYYMVDDWAARQYEDSEEAKALMARKSELEQEIMLRLGGDGQELLEILSDLRLGLEDIRGRALFRAAMQLGTRVAQPDGAYSTSR